MGCRWEIRVNNNGYKHRMKSDGLLLAKLHLITSDRNETLMEVKGGAPVVVEVFL